MTDHDIQLLALGATLGVYAMTLAHIAFGIIDNRRDRKAVRDAEAQLEAAQKKASA